MFERVQALRGLAAAAAVMTAMSAASQVRAKETRAAQPGTTSANPTSAEAPLAETQIVATIDQARLVKIPAGTETLVIGNPTIADVTLLRKNNLMVLTPKAFGETNFIALDGKGNPVAESMIQVVAGTNSLIVQRGGERQSYSCAPRCQPIERLGDDAAYMSGVAGLAQQHTARLSGSPVPVAPGSIK